MVKTRFDFSSGLLGQQGAWDIDTMPIADFGNVNLAGAGTIRAGFNCLPLVNPAHLIKSPDNEPFEDPGGLLVAANGARVIGSGRQPMAVLLGAYLVHVTPAAGVYQPVTTTVNVRVGNAAAAVGGAFATLATINASAATNFIDVMPVVAPAERQINIEGGASAIAAAALFNGDYVFCELVAAGALNVVGNLFYVMLELA